MSNHIMNVDFFGNTVKAETDTGMISLNDLFNAGNAYRLSKGKAALQMNAFLNSVSLNDYIEAASEEWNKDKSEFIKKTGTSKKTTKTNVHISIAMLAAEQISPAFHAKVHKEFIEGKLLEFRQLGATEFTNLNNAIDLFLPIDERNKKQAYIDCAKAVREKIMGIGAKVGCWDNATVSQTQQRYKLVDMLCKTLKLGLIRDFSHLLEMIEKIN